MGDNPIPTRAPATEVEYPEHAKLSAVQDEYNAVREFLDSVTDGGTQLCRMQDSGLRSLVDGVIEQWFPQDWRAILNDHFGIDELALERERRAMLATLSGGAS